MDATLYTGTGAAQTIYNAGQFAPDMMWLKNRSAGSTSHILVDSVRGSSNVLTPQTTTGDQNLPSYVSSLNTNGVSLGTGSGGNTADISTSGSNYVVWQFKAGGTAVTNNNGFVPSQVSANSTSGFSIATYTGNGSNSSVGHGLGVAPSLIIVKCRSTTSDWYVYHASLGTGAYLKLDSNGYTTSDANYFTSSTSTLFSMTGSATAINTNAATYVAYCWAPVAGYSQFGSYTGNGSTDGTFVYTGFRPRWLLIKRTDSGTNDWALFDSAREDININNAKGLKPNTNGAEYTGNNYHDLLSNGFKFRNGDTDTNASGATYVYATFAEAPFKFANAR